MKNAKGQLLGYSIQYPRAIYHLLKGKSGDRICIEEIGDVSVENDDGKLVSEEDKSSVTGNPVTDRSKDLWKTLFNWIDSIKEKEIVISNTQFILYSNKKGIYAIVDKFSELKNAIEIETYVDEIKKDKLKDIDSKHEIWNYYNYVINDNADILKSLIPKFEFITGSECSFDEIFHEFDKLFIPKTAYEETLEKLCGWIFIDVTSKIAKKERVEIKYEDFHNYFSTLLSKIRALELVDFAIGLINDVEVDQKANYITQLMMIDADESEILEAASNYIKASTNFEKWVEKGIVDHEDISNLENNLVSFWKNTNKANNIKFKKCDKCEKGQLLYSDCMTRQVKIRNQDPPHGTISGTYHNLADSLELGWHEEWIKLKENRLKDE